MSEPRTDVAAPVMPRPGRGVPPQGSELALALDALTVALRAQNEAEADREALSMRLAAAASHATECRLAVDKADSKVRQLLGGQYG